MTTDASSISRRLATIPRKYRRYRAWAAARRIPGGVRAPAFRELVQRIDRGPLHDCPPVELLIDGDDAFRTMMLAMDAAQDEVLLETYIMRDDRLGQAVQEALLRAAARGVRVCVLADAVGSLGTGNAFWDHLERHGVTVRLFQRLWHHPLEALRRDHRKLLVVDREIAFTGGMNIGEEYGSSVVTRGATAWRDTFIRVGGSVALELAAVFAEGWDRARGEPLPALEYVSWSEGIVVPPWTSSTAYAPRALTARVRKQWARRRDKRGGRHVVRPEVEPPTDRAVLVLDPRPGRGQNEMLSVLSALIGGARERLWITTPYFAPPSRALTLLLSAARRGVDVRLLLPGEQTDMPIVRHAAHGAYAPLLKQGVRIYEYQRATLHAKTLVVDGSVSMVGSSNLDFRSFWLNAECNVLLFDDECGATLERSFRNDLQHSVEITAAAWRTRGIGHRLLDRTARALRWAL